VRIILHSNLDAPWTITGYGQQTALLAPRLRDAGHEVAISAFWGLAGASLTWNGIPVYPSGNDLYGNDVLAGHVRHFGADLVITLIDMWVLSPDLLSSLPVACWMPVDTRPLGNANHTVLTAAPTVVPVAAEGGHGDRLAEAGFRPCYVPHGIDTSLFTPPADRDACREALGVTGKFVIGINAANKDTFRKGYAEQFAAFARFHARHPDTALAVHALAATSGAVDLRALADQLGILDAVFLAPQYEYMTGLITPTQMASWYGALDLYSGCSYGEGFGLPLAEAQSCGVPVVVTDASSMTELCGAGWKVGGEKLWYPLQQAWWVKPSIDAIARTYEKAYTDRKVLAAKAAKARDFALAYDADEVLAKHWLPVLDELAERTRR
jgi:glycosyltransferase involved in cell wall biosynthesis